MWRMIDFTTWYFQIAAAVIILVSFVYWKYGASFDYWEKRNVHFLKPNFLFGNIKDTLLMQKSEAETYQKIYQQLDGHAYGGIYFPEKPCLLIRDPGLIKSVMVKDFSHFHDRGRLVDEENDPLSAHLFSLGGQRWRNLRVKLTPTFTSGKMKAAFPILTQCCEHMVTNLESSAAKKETIEVKEVFAQTTTDIIGSYAFGLQLNTIQDPNNKFREFGRKMFELSFSFRLLFLILVFVQSLGKLVNKFRSQEMEKFFIGAVTDTIKYREQNNIKRNDFLQLLIQLKNKGKLEGDVTYSKDDAYLQNSISNGMSHDTNEGHDIVLTDNLLAAQCFVFFLAGFETSSTTASFCLYELALNPDIQERVRTEIDTVLKEHDGKITYEAIQKMKYMDKVVDEALRKFPPVMKLERVCTKPYIIPGTDTVIEKGVYVIIPCYGLHHDAKYYPDPDRFDPERFSDESSASRTPYTYLPFGDGPRICIGMRFGLLQTKVGLAALLSKYKFTVSDKTPIPMVFDPKARVLTAKGGMWLQISKR